MPSPKRRKSRRSPCKAPYVRQRDGSCRWSRTLALKQSHQLRRNAASKTIARARPQRTPTSPPTADALLVIHKDTTTGPYLERTRGRGPYFAELYVFVGSTALGELLPFFREAFPSQSFEVDLGPTFIMVSIPWFSQLARQTNVKALASYGTPQGWWKIFKPGVETALTQRFGPFTTKTSADASGLRATFTFAR